MAKTITIDEKGKKSVEDVVSVVSQERIKQSKEQGKEMTSQEKRLEEERVRQAMLYGGVYDERLDR